MSALLEACDLCFSYRDGPAILDQVAFAVEAGRRIGLTGANGCGKTTLLHCLVGLLKPTSGHVRFMGKPCIDEQDFHEVRRRVGLVFQDADDQLFCPTVLEDVAFGPLNLGHSPATARRIALDTLARIGLEGFEDRITYRLSGGEKRLVSLATVLAMDPDVLLLDEPTGGLDEESRERVGGILAALPQAMIIISHDRSFMERLATDIRVLRHGVMTAE